MGFFSIVKVGPFKTSKQILKTQFLKVVPFKVMISHHFKGPHLKNHKNNPSFQWPYLENHKNPSFQKSCLEHPKKSKFPRVRIITLKGPTLKILENPIWTYEKVPKNIIISEFPEFMFFNSFS